MSRARPLARSARCITLSSWWDGRREGYSTGASIPQLQQLFLDEGAEFAFNLDGGGSTTLYFRGEVINMPSGGKERSVSDIIMFTN